MTANGQVVAERVEKAASDSFVELGASGLVQYSGCLAEETAPQLRGDRLVATYRDMTHDPIVGGALLAIDNLVRRVEWEFDPPDDEKLGSDGQRWVDLCNSCLHDMSMSWADTVSAIFSMVPFGWSFCEVVLKHRNGEQPDTPDAPAGSDYSDGLVGWRKIALRSQDSLLRWELGPNGQVLGMWQQVRSLGAVPVLIPIQQAGLFRTTNYKDSPEGTSVLRSAFEPWWWKRRINELEGIGIERDLAGYPMAWVPKEMLASANPADKEAIRRIKELVTNIRRNSSEGGVFPLSYDSHGNKLFDFTLLSAPSRRQIDVDTTISRKNQEIALAILCDFMLLGHEAVGSKALGDSKIDLFTSALETWVKAVADVFNAHITPRLMRANGVAANLTPQLRPGLPKQVDIAAFATAMGELISTGAVTNDADTEGYIRETVGLPPRMEQGPTNEPIPLVPKPTGPPTAAEDQLAQAQNPRLALSNPNQKGAVAA